MTSIIIFFFALIVAVAMIARKIWHIRKGQVVAGSYEEADWTELSIESVRARLIELLKFSIHHFVLFLLKVWIITSNWVKRTDKNIKERLMHVIHKNGHLPVKGKPSGFLKHIREHKNEIRATLPKEGVSEEI